MKLTGQGEIFRSIARKINLTNAQMMLLTRYRWDIPYFAKKEILEPMGYILGKPQEGFFKWASNLDHRKSIVSGGRGSSKTLSGAILASWGATVLPYFIGRPYNTIVMGGSKEQSQKLYEYCTDFYKNSDFIGSQLDDIPLKSHTEFVTGSFIKAIPCSQKQTRSKHVDQLILDEVTQAKDKIVTSALPLTDESPYPRRIALSTPDEPGSIFVEWWLEADKWGFDKFNWNAEDCPWKDQTEVAIAKRNLTPAEYSAEYLGLPVQLEQMIVPIDRLRASKVEKRPYADKNTEVYGGIDWGLGGPHKTVLTLIKIQRGIKYVIESKEIPGTATVKHETILNELARHKLMKLCADNSHIGENTRLREKGIPLQQIAMGQAKDALVMKMQRLFEGNSEIDGNPLIRIWDEEEQLIKQLTLYHWMRKPSGKYTPEKGDDDFVDSLLYAIAAADTYVPDITQYFKVGKFDESGVEAD